MLFVFLYMFSLLMVMSGNNLLWLWISMEINLLMFLFILMKLNLDLVKGELCIIYFVIQLSLSLIMLLLLIFNFSWSLLILIGMMKVGMIPTLFLYYFFVVSNLFVEMIFILVLQKLPIFTFMKMGYSSLSMNFLVFFLLLSNLISISLYEFKELIMISSVTQSGWMVLFLTNTQNLFVLYFMNYSITMFMMLLFLSVVNKENSLLILILSSFPPFIFFFIKWVFMNSNIWLWSMFLLISSLFMYYSYLNFILQLSLENILIQISTPIILMSPLFSIYLI